MKSTQLESSRSLLLVCTIIIAVPVLFYQTTRSMLDVWSVNETYTHGFLIFPLSLWLIAEKRSQLARLWPSPAPLLLLATFLALCLWLISALVDVKVVMQLSMICVILTLVWAVTGRRIFFYLLFPLLFLFLAVPLGQSLIPLLMDFTADTTVRLIRLTGIPIYQDGLNFILPTGSWSVVEECSGVRYLIATVTLGMVYAYTSYASLKKRLVFIAFSIIVPVFANSLRAFIIVMLGHFSNMKVATGADHLLYGWVFFGIIIFTMFYIGSFWRDSQADFDQAAPAATQPCAQNRAFRYLLAGLAMALTFQLAFMQLQTQPGAAITPDRAHFPLAAQLGPWRQTGRDATGWQPVIHRPDLHIHRNYRRQQALVQLDVGYFFTQNSGDDSGEAVSSQNRLVDPYGGTWKIISSAGVDSGRFTVRQTVITYQGRKLLTWQWYQVGPYRSSNPYLAKINQAWLRLSTGRNDAAYITLATPLDDDMHTAQARLASFFDHAVDDISQAVEALHAQLAGSD